MKNNNLSFNLNVTKLITVLILCVQTQLLIGQGINNPFPADAWGLCSWTQFTKIDKGTSPLCKGGPIITSWTNIEPQNGVFAFNAEVKPKLQRALDNNWYVFLKIYLAAPATGGFTPEWL